MTVDDSALTNEQIADAVNQSGFPLQLGLQRIVANSLDWKLPLVEHSWTDSLSIDPKFIDFVVSGKHKPWRLVVEAKRARSTEWIFLISKRGASQKFDVQARAVSDTLPMNDWVRTYFLPLSHSASFCIVRKGNQYSQELLERTAAELVRATDALAEQETAISGRAMNRAGQLGTLGQLDGIPATRLYFPVIVTTARLYVAIGDYDETDLAQGDLADIAGEEVSMVRFTKSLSAPPIVTPRAPRAKDIRGLGQLAQRTVMVVQARHFSEFLGRWELKLDSAPDWLQNVDLLD